MINLGLIGYSSENGHPYSFSAIINGYNSLKLRESGWPVIADYLDKIPNSEIGIADCKITHIWTQDRSISNSISKACNVPNVCDTLDDMLGSVDAVIIARDDWECHLQIAKPFLLAGTPVFIDKPLTLDLDELRFFSRYLKSGQLMSCSGFRYAKEIADIKIDLDSYKFITSTVINDFTKYGIHMLEALVSSQESFSMPITITKANNKPDIYIFSYQNDVTYILNCIGNSSKAFQFNLYGASGNASMSIENNFAAFKSTLKAFVSMINEKKPAFDSSQTINLMLMLIAGNSLDVGQTVKFSEFFSRFEQRESIYVE